MASVVTMTPQSQTASIFVQRIAALRWCVPDTTLQAAIDDARDAGVSWQAIGDALGIARGNAYQRYRRRPAPKSYETDAHGRSA